MRFRRRVIRVDFTEASLGRSPSSRRAPSRGVEDPGARRARGTLDGARGSGGRRPSAVSHPAVSPPASGSRSIDPSRARRPRALTPALAS